MVSHSPHSHALSGIVHGLGAEELTAWECADVMDGYNGTVFAYGQTGSGKSHTMMVSIHLRPSARRRQLAPTPGLIAASAHSQGPSIDDDAMKGIIPRITEQIFASIMASPANLEYVSDPRALSPAPLRTLAQPAPAPRRSLRGWGGSRGRKGRLVPRDDTESWS